MRQQEHFNNTSYEDELPSPHELMPLTQSLITPSLALAFNIPTPTTTAVLDSSDQTNQNDTESARTLKRPRLVWTPQLHKRFVDAVAHLGIKNAVPKTIMQLMSVDGLTRENVASHLQKYRLYLKRMQGGMDRGGVSGSGSSSDAAMDRLFASSPVPPQFLRASSDHFMPPAFVHPMQVQQQQFMRSNGGGYEVPSFMRQHQQMQQGLVGRGQQQQAVYVEDLEAEPRGKRVLTLFPSG